jgi:hypothetical protein
MSDFEKQLRQHYEEQALPDARVQAILAAGRAAERARVRRRYWLAAAAAVVVLGLGWLGLRPGPRIIDAPAAGIRPDEVGAAVERFFAPPDYRLSQVSGNPAELMQWLKTQGAPPSFTLPAGLGSLPSFGCQVLDVRGQRVFLICFFLDVTPAELAAGGMIKAEMVVTAPDGSMMKKNRPLAHLVVAPASAFRSPPAAGTRVRFAGTGEWNFESWSQDGLVYLVAAAAPADKVAAAARPL